MSSFLRLIAGALSQSLQVATEQHEMNNLMMISDWGRHTRDKVDELSPYGSVVSRTDTS
jgi:hypothetical protein